MQKTADTVHEVLELFRSLPVLLLTNENESVLRLVTDHVFGNSPLQCKMEADRELTKVEYDTVHQILEQLNQQVPIQYILGEADFYDLKFKVNPLVLIPRQETEELVHWILSDIQDKKQPINIVDLGTGSGCIPISLKYNLQNAVVYGVDISPQALQMANENAMMNRTEVTFYRADVLNNPEMPFEQADIIVSNPPYVKNNEKREIAANVLNNEPHMALFVEDDNPLIFYNAIADLALKYLNPEGALYFEINQYLGKETVVLLEEKGFKAELRKDLNNNDRMIKAVFKK